MSVQDGSSVQPPARPIGDDHTAWRVYWQQVDQPWRTEPEINEERQKYLAERREIAPDIEKGIYPFKDIKLSRADVEWLLATHERGRGPVDWNDVSQKEREGLDLRCADLCMVDLSSLPLTSILGGLTGTIWLSSTPEQDNMAAVQMQGTILIHACLQGARLNKANLKGANLFQAHLESAELNHVQMEGASLLQAYMEKIQLRYAHLEEVDLRQGHLEGADLRRAFFNSATRLDDIILGVQENDFTSLVDISWEGANLAVIDWSHIKGIYFRHSATQQKKLHGEKWLNEYKRSVRAIRQLAVALQSQGLNEDANRFAYRAQKLQRVVLRLQRKFIQYFFSLLLDLLAGYGYRPIRTMFWYLLMVGGFAAAYAIFGHLPALPDALVFSLTSFHGRGFFPGLGAAASLHNPLIVFAAAEAVIGLFIEISFIATFTQRYFGK